MHVCVHVCVCNSFPFYRSENKEKDSKGTIIEAVDRAVGPNSSKKESNFQGCFCPWVRQRVAYFIFYLPARISEPKPVNCVPDIYTISSPTDTGNSK